MSPESEAHSCFLGLCHLRGPHSGENMAEVVIEILRDYNIIDQLGYFVLDNASSNDIYIMEILRQIRPDLSPTHCRLHCFGHIINLAAKSFLFGKDAEAFEIEMTVSAQLKQAEKELEQWRKLGPVGKLHNIVGFIRRTPQRHEDFEHLIKEDLDASASKCIIQCGILLLLYVIVNEIWISRA